MLADKKVNQMALLGERGFSTRPSWKQDPSVAHLFQAHTKPFSLGIHCKLIQRWLYRFCKLHSVLVGEGLLLHVQQAGQGFGVISEINLAQNTQTISSFVFTGLIRHFTLWYDRDFFLLNKQGDSLLVDIPACPYTLLQSSHPGCWGLTLILVLCGVFQIFWTSLIGHTRWQGVLDLFDSKLCYSLFVTYFLDFSGYIYFSFPNHLRVMMVCSSLWGWWFSSCETILTNN
jgi:hypothetical protein